MSVYDHLVCKSFLHAYGNTVAKHLVIPKLSSLGHQFLATSDGAEFHKDQLPQATAGTSIFSQSAGNKSLQEGELQHLKSAL